MLRFLNISRDFIAWWHEKSMGKRHEKHQQNQAIISHSNSFRGVRGWKVACSGSLRGVGRMGTGMACLRVGEGGECEVVGVSGR